MNKKFIMPQDLVTYFFQCIIEKGKYKIEKNNNIVVINPRDEQEYYKPQIIINDISKLHTSLEKYIHAIYDFYSNNNVELESYHDLSFFFNILLINMTNTDAQNLVDYIDRYTLMFNRDIFDEYVNKVNIMNTEDCNFYAQRVIENPGLETPYCMLFEMEKNNNTFELPLIRYTIVKDICYIYAIQMGRGRVFNYQDLEYKDIINQANKGLKKYRDVPPNFVLSFALFIKLLDSYNINNIMIPDYLFGRYKKYIGADTITKSDKIMKRILNKYFDLFCRFDMQIEGFDILTYPNDFDSYMRIKFKNLKSENKMLNEIFNSNKVSKLK